jgi:CBS domain-containing protein
MTVNPRTVSPSTPLDEVVRILLCATFTGLPVVDSDQRPVGLISQGDLIYRAGMPLRLCLLAASDESRLKAFLDSIASRTAAEIMTRPAVCIPEDRQLTESVDLMLQKGLKRLPVVDSGGRLVGIVSRMDLFRTIMKESPDWQTFKNLDIQVENLHSVSDIMRRDTHAVKPDTPLDEVVRIIDSNDIQRVAVVDEEGRYLGLISDEDLLAAFSRHSASLWDYVVSKMSFTEMGRKHKEILDHLQAGTAGELMSVTHITISEEAPMEEAIRLMTEHNLKRLPVLDSQGYYKGMVSRESLLRTGFTGCRI